MHQNRSRYTLPEYQKIIRGRYHKLGLVCENTQTGNYKIFRPVPSTPWIPEGRRKYYRKIRSRLDGVSNNRHYSFATLTYSSRFHTPVTAARRVKHDLDLFFKRLNYRNSKPEYFYVIELTDNFMVHVHLIFDRYVHKKKIFKSWNKITNSICIKIKHLPAQQAFYYCTKYLSNALKQNDDKWGFIFSHIDRIWSSSRNFFNKIDPSGGFFKFCFLLWNKNHYLEQYFPDHKSEINGVDLSELDFELLNLDSQKLDCQIRTSHPGVTRQLAPIALAPPVQSTFDFFTTSIYYT